MGVSHACMHADACCKHDKHGCLHVSGHLQISIHVYMCVCTCACMWGHPSCPQMPSDTPTYLAPPQSRREPKSPKFNKSLTNRDNSILFEDSLPLNTHPGHPPPPAPPPSAKKIQIRRITITLEQIEIIQFCLKIWDSCIVLHTYRLELMCGWGVSYP